MRIDRSRRAVDHQAHHLPAGREGDTGLGDRLEGVPADRGVEVDVSSDLADVERADACLSLLGLEIPPRQPPTPRGWRIVL